MTAWECREIWPTAPIGYISLLEFTDRIGRVLHGDRWREPPDTQQRQVTADEEFEDVITRVVKACEAGEIGSACRGPDDKMTDTLPNWHAKDWRVYFRQGVLFGPTDGLTFWIFVREGQADHFISGLTKPPASADIESTPAPHPGGRPPAVDRVMVGQEVSRLMNHHGEFSADDPDWNAQARLEAAIADFCETTFCKRPSETTIKDNIREPLKRWRQARSET
jgi:hypothetical protein